MEIIETNLNFKAMDTRTKTERIILHHADASNCTAEQIHQWHLNKGWAGAGYHFLVIKDGTIYRLRPEDKVGAHAYGSNFDSLGICFEGKYMEEEMSETQIKAGKELVAYLKEKYNVTVVQKHSDVCATSCPGQNFKFDEIANMTIKNETIKKEQQQVTSLEDKNANMGDVATIQSTLNEKYGLNIAVDNIPGNETDKALIKALQIELNTQFDAGLIVDGIVGTKTREACVNVRNGASGNITWLIQAMLVCKGFDIAADGIFGSETENAVKEFQQKNNLAVDGIVGKNTFKALLK